MVSTRRTPSRLDSIPQGFTLVSKPPLKSVQSKRTGLRPRSFHCDLSEPEASSDVSTSDAITWSSSPPPSPQKKSLRSSKSCRKNHGTAGPQEATPLPKSRSMMLPIQEAVSPVRKRLRAIENIQTRTAIPKSRSHPQSLSKKLTSLCDQLAVETPKNSTFPTVAGFPNVFAHARHLLKLSSTDVISSEEFLGRSKELLKLKFFLSDRYRNLMNFGPAPADSSSTHSNPSSGSLYISGPPGTGKTHMIKSVLLNQDHEVGRALTKAGVQAHFINCVALSTSTRASGLSSGTGLNALDEQLWHQVAASLGISRPTLHGKNLSSRALVEAQVMEDNIIPSLIILDEIDYLAASKLPLITPLLSLSQRSPNANFTIVGIANTLDLTSRLIKPSRSSGNSEIEPQLIHFTSFQSTDLVDIAKQRLRHLYTSYAQQVGPDWPSSTPQKLFAGSALDVSLNQDASSIPLFHPAALQLCAKKVSAVTGDLRTFLSILRKLVDLLEQNAIRNSQFLEQSLGSQKSVLDTPTKMRKFTRIISTSQLAPDLSGRSSENQWSKTKVNDPCNHFTPHTAPKISPSDVVKYFKTSGILETPTFDTSQMECLKKLQDLNLHQSLVLVCLCVAWSREQDESNNTGCAIARSQAYEIYRNCLKPAGGYSARNTFNVGISPVSESEWADLLESGLQTRGLVNCLNERAGLSRPSTPSTSHNNPGPSPFKSPSKRKQGPFQRSALCTPTKLKPIGFNSPQSSHRTSPSKSNANDRSFGQALLVPVHSISVLIQAIQSVANRTEVTSDDAPRFSPEIISILNQLLISEEKRARVIKKRKVAPMDHVETIGRKATFARFDDDEVEQENLVKGRMVTTEDEGSCRD